MRQPAADPSSYPPRIVSGLEPTPEVHLGHYAGAIRKLIRLQNEYPGDTFYIVADFHSMAVKGAEALRRDTLELATALLALGLDPNKTILYRQSDVPACAELVWYVASLIPSSQLSSNPAFRELLESAGAPSAGATLYPLLMAADVLCQRGTWIQVGVDQKLNAEVVRGIAGELNRFFDWEVFPLPQVEYSGQEVVVGIDGQRMSLANENTIGVFEPFYRLQQQVNAITDEPPKDGPDCIVCHLYSLVANPEQAAEMTEQCSAGALDGEEAKRRLIQAIQETFAESQERYHRLKQESNFVLDVLHEGGRQAQEEARQTLELVRDLLGLTA